MVRFLIVLMLAMTGGHVYGQTDEYRIRAGDVVAIEVFGETDLSPRLKVDETGAITYPFLGEIRASGLTARALEQTLLQGLKGPYLIDPQVTVTIAEYRPFYINGQVKSPGGFSWQPGMTVRKAVTLAGGLTERASARKIFLQPEGGSERDRIRVELDHAVTPGDIITIEESFF